MSLDCYDYYLWTIGEIALPPHLVLEITEEE